MKNLSDIPPDIATEAAACFPTTPQSYALSLETARKVFTAREVERLFRELSQRGTTEAAALVFIIRAGCWVNHDGWNLILKHCREPTPAPDMADALGDITAALDAALHLPGLRETLEKVPYVGNWTDGEGNPFPCKIQAVYTALPGCSPVPPVPLGLPHLMGFLNDQLKRVEIERRKGRKVKTYRRRIVREMARLWEKTTGDAPTISDGCGFLFALGVVWDATAREAHAWIDMREGLAARAGRTFNHGLDLSHLEPGVEDMRNELRAVLNEGKS